MQPPIQKGSTVVYQYLVQGPELRTSVAIVESVRVPKGGGAPICTLRTRTGGEEILVHDIGPCGKGRRDTGYFFPKPMAEAAPAEAEAPTGDQQPAGAKDAKPGK